MSLVEPPPPTPQPEPWGPQPAWLGPPENILGSGCALGLLLARSDGVALGITGLVGFPSGFSFVLSLRRRTPTSHDPEWGDPWFHVRSQPGEPLPEVLRLSVEFADGRKATTLDGFPSLDPREPDQLPPGPVLIHRGGGGGGRAFDHDYWVWPLPPVGPLAFVCEWPAEGIPLTRVEVDDAGLIAAAKQAQMLWPSSASTGD